MSITDKPNKPHIRRARLACRKQKTIISLQEYKQIVCYTMTLFL